ncbi:MAG: transposase [Pseudanabaena sp. M135S2SP2A07QC]|nr:transposase [Pseudanabaena sp. M176S2SP2A07QC]MCA6540596.1 transposase [Pseudanabaena sp. M037S2SP2A07QC]MCA6542503.1 transposase [Pseudanabaena sp. M074S1SP2A07QC]MCA6547695.1 transposase [Pseudanabaena sp. M152S2SP2A07QC]MCA6554643.1 transposase [Pseudanabaena sp. M135S2SP2A07QC]MCA6566543.1 transposase [Pseudanabaena sp. M151S2SP2A07QC]MCA6570356.1 transposase [Pseudanabaena sp. M065S1SP2A07QC]MCA6580050.1 transposase [Pseudanabaena sp. M085S1SP2A07QC]
MEAELSSHIGYGKHGRRPEGQSNSRNDYCQKTVQGDFGVAEIAVPMIAKGSLNRNW